MGFFDLLNDTLGLMKNTFVVMGKNPAILRPTLTQIMLGLIFYLILITSAVAIIFTTGAVQIASIYVFIIFFMLLVPIFPYIKMYYRAAQSWIVYNTFTGKNISYKQGIKRANKNKGDIFILATFDILLTALARKLKQGTGRGGLYIILNMLMWIIGKIVEEGWDLIGHYLLPASIIHEKNVGEVLPDIPKIKKNVPGALAGVFAFDFSGDLILRYINFFMILFLFLGIITWFFLGTFIPLLIIIILLIGINFIIKILIDMVKTVYFTLFYVSVVMPRKITPKYRKQVTNYLLHKT